MKFACYLYYNLSQIMTLEVLRWLLHIYYNLELFPQVTKYSSNQKYLCTFWAFFLIGSSFVPRNSCCSRRCGIRLCINYQSVCIMLECTLSSHHRKFRGKRKKDILLGLKNIPWESSLKFPNSHTIKDSFHRQVTRQP